VSRPALRPTQPPVQWVPGVFPGVKRGRGLSWPHPSSAEVNEYKLYSSPPCRLHDGSGRALLLGFFPWRWVGSSTQALMPTYVSILRISQMIWSLESDGEMIYWRENRRTRRKNCPGATLSTTIPTWIDPGAIPSLRGERPATNDLSHGTAFTFRLVWVIRRERNVEGYAWCLVSGCHFVPHAVSSLSFVFRHFMASEHPVWWPGLKNSSTVTHACRKRRLKCVPSAWGYSWTTQSPGVLIRRLGPPGWGLGAALTIQPRKRLLLRKPKRGGQGPIWAVELYDDDYDDGVRTLDAATLGVGL
jgi:hypothetical protein